MRDALIGTHASFTSLVDRGFWACRAFAAILLPASLVYDGVGALVVELALPVDDPSLAPIRFANTIFLTSVLGFLGSYAISAGLIRLALGEQPSPSAVLAAPWREAQWALPIAFLFSAIGLAGFLLGVLPAIVVEVLLLVIAPVCAVEHAGARDALGRAWRLAEGHRLRATGIYGFVILGAIVSSLPILALEAHDAVPALALAACLQALVSYFGDTVVFLFYADLRVRKESFDLELLARTVGGDGGSAGTGSPDV